LNKEILNLHLSVSKLTAKGVLFVEDIENYRLVYDES